MAISVFLSTVSDGFRAYRDQLVHDLTRQNVAVKVQEISRISAETRSTGCHVNVEELGEQSALPSVFALNKALHQ
jgi:hypothetical protein